MSQQMCEECGINPANIHFTQIAENTTTVMHLCELCAGKKGIHVSFEPGETPMPPPAQQAGEDVACPGCHLKMSMYKSNGRLGCARCYEAFSTEIDGLFAQVHGAQMHKGKQYGRPKDAGTGTEDIMMLRDALRNAVSGEKFELAASIRDKIKSLSTNHAFSGDFASS